MDIKIVAEYVENEEIFNSMKELGVDYFQGYYIGKPSPVKLI
jgi:EAL domain-containing protein (putative c-di-GMP-specific phosphodiesterase class I)